MAAQSRFDGALDFEPHFLGLVLVLGYVLALRLAFGAFRNVGESFHFPANSFDPSRKVEKSGFTFKSRAVFKDLSADIDKFAHACQ